MFCNYVHKDNQGFNPVGEGEGGNDSHPPLKLKNNKNNEYVITTSL